LVLALALALMLALAGCIDAAGRLQMTKVDDAGLTEQASIPATGGDHYHQVAGRRIARHAIENGSTNVTVGDRSRSVRTEFPYEYEGAYYNVSRRVVDSRRGTGTWLEIDHNGTDENGTRFAFADLSPADRRQLGPALSFDPPRLEPGPDSHVPVAYTPPERNGSVLLDHDGERITVVRDGREYGVRVRLADTVTVETHRYDVELTANDTEEYATTLKREYAFTLRSEDLDEAEREVVEEAIGSGTYYAEDTSDGGFDALVDRFLGHRAVQRDDYSGYWAVRYEGQLYWADLDYGEFVTEEGDDRTAAEETETATRAVTPDRPAWGGGWLTPAV